MPKRTLEEAEKHIAELEQLLYNKPAPETKPDEDPAKEETHKAKAKPTHK